MVYSGYKMNGRASFNVNICKRRKKFLIPVQRLTVQFDTRRRDESRESE